MTPEQLEAGRAAVTRADELTKEIAAIDRAVAGHSTAHVDFRASRNDGVSLLPIPGLLPDVLMTGLLAVRNAKRLELEALKFPDATGGSST